MNLGLSFLIIRSGGLGDSILTLPVAVRLREVHPDAGLHVLGNGNMLDAARLSGLFESFHSLDEAGFAALFTGNEPTRFLRSFFSQFNRVFCFSAGNGEEIARIVRESGARSCRVLDPRPPRNWDRHITEYFLTIIDSVIPFPAIPPALPAAPAHQSGKELLAIHPGSGGVPKTWPLERFMAVAERWHGETLFLLGPAEMERGYMDRIPERFRVEANPSLVEAAALIRGASRYLGNDSGVSHLAAMCGTPSVVLFGPTAPKVWRPWGERVLVIASSDGSMEGIGVEEVVRAVKSV